MSPIEIKSFTRPDSDCSSKLSSVHCFTAQQMERANFFINQKLFPYYNCKRNFGKQIADYLWEDRFDRTKWLEKCKIIIEKEFSSIIQKYIVEDLKQDIYKENKIHNVWSCWFQGEKNLPEVVRICVDSQKRNLPIGVNYNFLSFDNIENYIELPGFIIDNTKSGRLSFTHLSDIVRFKLLSQYGGIWMDSTLFVSDEIPREYFGLPIFSIQMKDKYQLENNIFYWPLCSFLIGGSAQSTLFRFCYELMIEYQKKYKWLIDGHLINICYAIAFSNFTKTRKYIEQIGANNENRYELDSISNTPYNGKVFSALLCNQIFHKLNWRKDYKRYISGKETFWGHVAFQEKWNYH